MTDPEEERITISYTVEPWTKDTINLGFVGTYTDPSTGDERTFLRDTRADVEKAIRLDIARRYGFDRMVSRKDAE